MTRKMIINAVDPEEVRIAIVGDGRLEDYDIETKGVEKNRGNIYKGVVMAVEPALNAAFVDYGADKQGFLTANDVDPQQCAGKDPSKSYRIHELLKPKQEVLVQITKDEVGSKGAVLSTYLSLAGRYVVLMPGSSRHGVSRKIEDDDTRRKMREAAAKLEVPEDIGVIIRTAGKDRTKQDLNRDLKVLLRLWENIKKESERAKAPALIFKEQDVIIRALRDYFTADIDEIILDSDEAYDRAAEYMHMVMPRQKYVLTRYVERRPIFHHYKIEEQLEALYTNRVELKSGGSIVIEPTEALVAIDVNSGKQKLGGQEETALQTNLEAAREVARQLRLRDLGGIIVVDFIDMGGRKHEQRVERALKQAVKEDRARIKVGRISPNGTLELTRQRIGSALQVSMFRRCTTCSGSGYVLKPEAHAVSVLRALRDRAARGDLLAAKVRVESETANHLKTEKWHAIQELEQHFNIRVEVVADHSMQPGQDDFTYETDPNAEVADLEEPDFGPAWKPEDATSLDEELERTEPKEPRAVAESDNGARETQSGLDLPSFELLDPAEVGLSPTAGDRRTAGEKSDSANRRRRGRRGGRKRSSGARTREQHAGGRANQQANAQQTKSRAQKANGARAPEAQPDEQKPAAAAAAPAASTSNNDSPTVETAARAKKKKLSFFARLFGRKG